MNTATKAAIDALASTVAPAVHEALSGHAVTPGTKNEIIQGVVEKVAPVIVNQANAEPWYKSRIIVTQWVTLAATVLGLIGYSVTPEYRDQIIAAVLVIGPVLAPIVTLAARQNWFGWAKKPLGA